jgi:hypothetical protein
MSVKYVEDKNALYIKDAVLYWASVHTPKLKYGSQTDKEYQITVLVTEEDMKALKKIKLNKEYKHVGDDIDVEKFPDCEGLWVVKFSQPALAKSGKKLSVVVKNADGSDLEKEIGNGSKGHIKLYAQEGVGVSKGKVNTRLNAVVVTELIEYSGGSDGFDSELGVSTRSNKKQEDDDLSFDDEEIPF